MSEELKTRRAAECFDGLYGVDGDGLGEGEVACEEELAECFALCCCEQNG